MARIKRTSEDMKKDLETIRKYAGRVSSMTDWADLLDITMGQLKYTFDAMPVDEANEIRRKTSYLNKLHRNSRNWVDLCFKTSDILGVTKVGTRKVGKFIDPLTCSTILTEGVFKPRVYDILYIVEVCKNQIHFQKFLIDSVVVREGKIYIEALRIAKADLTTETLQFLEGFCGLDRYILSIM